MIRQTLGVLDLAPALDAFRDTAAAVVVPRDGVRVSGPDAASFLQGQLSQDVGALEPGSGAYSLLLQPQGKVDAWLRVVRIDDDEFVLDVEPGWGARVIARLERFKLRTKADIAPGEWGSVAVLGPEAAAVASTVGTAGVATFDPHWIGSPGVDLLGSSVPLPDGVPEAPIDAYELARIEAGVPRLGAELDESTIPAEAGRWLIDVSVSFTKGCYTGQELVARIDSRGGNVPRRLRRVRFADGVPAAGSRLLRDGDDVGVLTSVATAATARGSVGLAIVGRAVEPPAKVAAAGGGGAVLYEGVLEELHAVA